MKRIIFAILILLLVSNFNAQVSDSYFLTDLNEAKTKAKNEQKSIMMIFSGSDWCYPCMCFKKGILLNEEFKKFSDTNMVVLYLDFPSKKKNKLSENKSKHNDKLAKQYNSQGVFPKILIINSDQKLLGEMLFNKQKPKDFIHECRKYIPSKKEQTDTTVQIHNVKKAMKLMGCNFEISAVANSESNALAAIEKGVNEIKRIEKLISSWDVNSQTFQINLMAGILPVKVNEELFELIYRAKKISKLTNGAFDISFASQNGLWVFDKKEHSMPDIKTIQTSINLINWENIILDRNKHTVFLKEKGMRIGFGAIGKGYAANKAKNIMKNIPGIVGGLVNASGDLIAWGVNAKQDDWSIKIADPKNSKKSIGSIDLKDLSIVTSGNYEKYFTSNGSRYAHIINPKNGFPTTGIKSVSIISPDTEFGDALATSIFVLGKEKGLELVNKLNQVECLIILDNDEIISSKNLKLNYYK